MIRILHTPHNQGFHMQFSNGWLLSVQIGPGNYHSNRSFGVANSLGCQTESPNAEIAVWHRDSKMVRWPDSNDCVRGYVTADQIAKVIDYVSHLADDPTAWAGGQGACQSGTARLG